MPVELELTNAVQVKTSSLYGSVASEVQESEEIDEDELMWAPSDKSFDKLERPDEATAVNFEHLNLSRHLNADEGIRLISLLREFPKYSHPQAPSLDVPMS